MQTRILEEKKCLIVCVRNHRLLVPKLDNSCSLELNILQRSKWWRSWLQCIHPALNFVLVASCTLTFSQLGCLLDLCYKRRECLYKCYKYKKCQYVIRVAVVYFCRRSWFHSRQGGTVFAQFDAGDVLLYLKLYNPRTKTVSYCGHLYVPISAKASKSSLLMPPPPIFCTMGWFEVMVMFHVHTKWGPLNWGDWGLEFYFQHWPTPNS